MKYENIYEGTFIKRINRFIANVNIDGSEELVHIKNTGRCKELFIEGSKIFLEKSNNPNRKTKYSLISIYKGNELINIDSQVPNKMVYDGILDGSIEGFKDITLLRREKTYGNSRFDLYYEKENEKGFIEVKGVTLENNKIASFPDAPTTRGTKHVNELIKGQEEGYKNYIVLVIQLENVNLFVPNYKTDPVFGKSLKNADLKGVEIRVYNSLVTFNTIAINKPIKYSLKQENTF